MKNIFIVLILFPFYSFSQGINWTEGLSWDEVKKRALLEKKSIFVDCYTTWCAPCKKMDKEVYINDTVGQYINKFFIAIKLQMDSSKKDNDLIKASYKDAHFVKNEYSVESFPTFLFFSPTGEIVHKETGYWPVSQFISICSDARDPNKQFYALLEKYKHGQKNYKMMPTLAFNANKYKEAKWASIIAEDYLENYLLPQKKKIQFNGDNVRLLRTFTKSTKDKGFSILYNNQEKINKVMQDPVYVQDFLHYIISKGELDPVLGAADKSGINTIDWKTLEKGIKKKYNSYYAARTILAAKLRWAAVKKDWPSYTAYTTDFVEKFGTHMNEFDLATRAWTIFEFSNNENELNTAIKWSKRVIERSTDSSNILPAILDTYVNLRYKINFLFKRNFPINELIATEEKALAMATQHKVDNMIDSFKEVMDKIKKGEPTWENK